MIVLRQSTAGQEIPIGQFVDATDGVTAETALTIANTDIKLWKWGATTLANKNSGGGTHMANGVYYATLDATDTNTLGTMTVYVNESGALTERATCLVIEAQVWDLLFGGYNSTLQGTATAGTTSSITFPAAFSTTVDYYNSWWLEIVGGTGAGQGARYVVDYSAARVATVDPAFTTTPDATSVFRLYNAPPAAAAAAYAATVNVGFVGGVAEDLPTATALQTVDNIVDTINTNVGSILTDTGTSLPLQLDEIAGATFNTATDSLEAIRDRGDAAWVTGAGGSAPTVVQIRQEMDTNSTQLAAIVADTGTTLPATLSTIEGKVDTVDTVADAVKAKTDSLTFTLAGHVDANVQRINDVLITGDGGTGTEFGV